MRERISMDTAVEWDEDAASRAPYALSEENLRIHNAAIPKNDGYFQVNLIREERARAAEHQTYRQLFGDVDRLSDAEFSPLETDLTARREACLDALKLYSGSFASLSTPMDRFVAMSPTQDAHPWLARDAMHDSGIPFGDLEALDVRRLASEMLSIEAVPGESPELSVGPGTPRPSSDTLSVARCLATIKERKECGVRTHKTMRMRMRRRSTVDKAGKARPSPQRPGSEQIVAS